MAMNNTLTIGGGGLIFVFIPYISGTILPKNVYRIGEFGKKILWGGEGGGWTLSVHKGVKGISAEGELKPANYEKSAGILLFTNCDALRDLVIFVQFKKREKHPSIGVFRVF